MVNRNFVGGGFAQVEVRAVVIRADEGRGRSSKWELDDGCFDGYAQAAKKAHPSI